MRWQLRVCFLYKDKKNPLLDILFKGFEYVTFLYQHGCKHKHNDITNNQVHNHHLLSKFHQLDVTLVSINILIKQSNTNLRDGGGVGRPRKRWKDTWSFKGTGQKT
jgi:hypothetical protein